MPVGEVHMESAENVNVHNLTKVVESVRGDNRDDSHIIVSQLLHENLDVLDDSALRYLIGNAPVEFRTVLEEQGFTVDVIGVATGQFTENVTFSDNAVDLESGNWTSALSKNAVHVSGKRKATGAEVESGSVPHPKIVASEIGDGSDEERVALQEELGNQCMEVVSQQ